MIDKPTVVDLGWCVARYSKAENGLSIASPTDYRFQNIVPAASVVVKTDYCPALRDFLLAWFPVEPSVEFSQEARRVIVYVSPIDGKETPSPTVPDGWTAVPNADYVELTRKAAAYDEERARAIRGERPASTESSQDFASGAFEEGAK